MIFWIFSYWIHHIPKVGIHMVKSFLSSYFYSEDGFFDQDLLKNIDQFQKKDILAILIMILK